jgi:hypothetical protein
VIGQPKLVVMCLLVENNSSSTFLKSLQLLKPVQNNDVIASSFKDQLIDFSNDPVRVIETLRCYSRLAMHEGLISTPQYNGWLATSMVRLSKCTKLTAYWKTNETLLLQKKFRFSPFVQKQRNSISVLPVGLRATIKGLVLRIYDSLL